MKNCSEGSGPPFEPTEAYRHRFAQVRREHGSADYEMWAAHPELWEKVAEQEGEPEFTWVHRVHEAQARGLRQSFHDWRRDHCRVPPEPDFLNRNPCFREKPGRLVDRMEDRELHLAVTALTGNFLHSVVPEAEALGAPAEALLWAGMLYDDVTTKDYTFADMLRVVTRAEEFWSKALRIQFKDEDELESFVFAVLVERAESPCDKWDEEVPERVVAEYEILRDFCGFMAVVGGRSDFGKAMACALPMQPSITNVKAFRERATAGAEKFDKLWLVASMPF